MHLKKKVIVVAAAVLATAAVGEAAVMASTPRSPRIVQRMHLVEREAGGRFVDSGKQGPSVGDQDIGRSDVLDTKGNVVGRMDGVCTITGTGKQLGGVCNGVLTLKAGQLVGAFAWGRAGSSHLQAIVGGTGRYAGARGQFLVDTNGTDKHEDFTVELYGK
jgi:hypothetical protein